MSSSRNGYLPLPGVTAPARSIKGSFRRLRNVALSILAIVVIVEAFFYVPYLAGEERIKAWGLDRGAGWINDIKGGWIPPSITPGGHTIPPPPPPPPPHAQHQPHKPALPDAYDAPYSPSRDHARIPPSSFPPPYAEHFRYDAATKYSNGNPHAGVIPPLQLHLLNNVGQPQPPVRPPAAPAINSTVWDKPRWSKALNGSRTVFADAFRAHTQPDDDDFRLPPYNKWKSPKEQLDPSTPPQQPLSRVQYDFQDPTRRSGKAGDHAREATLIERQRLVKAAFMHSWEGYKRIAWGHDEMKPVSEQAQDPFNGWGATIVDALDTLLVMDLPDEYNYAREHVRDIDFWYLGGERSAYGRQDGRVPVFETAIRYLGGFLSAYDLSGDELMKDRAEELAQLILPAFFTRTGVPLGRVRFGAVPYSGAGGGVLLAEAGSMLLEFTRLWQVTGNRTYFDRVQRTTDWLDRNMTKEARLGSLLPTSIFPETGAGYGWYSFGGMADSFYEYLIKGHQLLGGKVPQYARMYSEAIDSARRYLIKEVRSVPGTDLVAFGMTNSRFWEAKQEHLACFTGGMLGLGAKLMPTMRGQDVDIAQRVTETCWWTYNSSATGLGPEDTTFYRSDDALRFEMDTEPDGTQRRGKARGWPIVGVARQTSDYRGRPETIESVLYMWRITGDPVWQDRGWQMFASWVTHAMTKVGFANIQDVQALPAILNDNMESFVFAETFKYYYLLFSPPNLISLDDYVFTTEAHPLLAPKSGRWTEPGKGPRSFWSGPRTVLPSSPDAPTASDEYHGGEGGAYGGMTNVQKHNVYKAWQAQEEQKRVQAQKAKAKAKLAEVVERAKEAGSEAVQSLVARMKGLVGEGAAEKTVERRDVDEEARAGSEQLKRPVAVELTDSVARALKALQEAGVATLVAGGEALGELGGGEEGVKIDSAVIQTDNGPIDIRFVAPGSLNAGAGEGDEGEKQDYAILTTEKVEVFKASANDKEGDEEEAEAAELPPVPTEVADFAELEEISLAGADALRYALGQLLMRADAKKEGKEYDGDAAAPTAKPTASSTAPLSLTSSIDSTPVQRPGASPTETAFASPPVMAEPPRLPPAYPPQPLGMGFAGRMHANARRVEQAEAQRRAREEEEEKQQQQQQQQQA